MKYVGKIEKIRRASNALTEVPASELRSRSLALKHVAMCGSPVSKMVDDGFPLVVEAVRRCLGIVYHDVQLQCGIEMARGRIAEMKTGEGKTVTASLAGYLFALYGKGMHLATFNDYLAERDREINQPVFQLLGLSTGFLKSTSYPDEREAAYNSDITYGAAKEFGFDFLRDRLQTLAPAGNRTVTRGTHFALLDEADSILIDEAKTPLIIGLQDVGETSIVNACFRWAAQFCSRFAEGTHFERKSNEESFQLSAGGIRLVRSLPQNESTTQVPLHELNRYIENALKARHLYTKDKNYALQDGNIVIIDEFTGRPAEGRQWKEGIHQSIQAKEGLEIVPETRQAACITIQSYFKRYRKFCGMTGTAWTSSRELSTIYKKKVARISTHRPVQRQSYAPRVYAKEVDKLQAIAESARRETQKGRAVLIGTRSVAQSEDTAKSLAELGLRYDVLNAKNLQLEGTIIGQAGQTPRITIATNMAGRGTDIKLSKEVRDAGGLHVILSELHESARIDWQLVGRGARQGDPGSYQIFVALTDEILVKGLGRIKAARLMAKFESASAARLQRLFPVFKRAQRKAEKSNLIDRLIILRRDQEQKRIAFDLGQDPYLSSVTS
ncbi:MAG: preprotein translocase subunit SecA [Planctomycetota bacterium]